MVTGIVTRTVTQGVPSPAFNPKQSKEVVETIANRNEVWEFSYVVLSRKMIILTKRLFGP